MDKKHNRNLLLLLFFGVLMGALDISIVGPALPSIEKSLQVDQRTLSWVFSIYILFNLVGLPLLTRLSDVFGRRAIYVISIVLFAIGSLVSAMSSSIEWLLAGRAIQGFGASGIFPVATAVVGDVFPQEKRGRILGLLGAVFGIAFIIGPVIAGVLLSFFEWNSLFLINVPISLLLLVGAIRLVPAHRVADKSMIDWPGIITLAVILASFTWAINNLDSEHIGYSLLSARVLPFFMVALVLLTAFFFMERKASLPIIKMGFFRNKQIRIVGFLAMGTGMFQGAIVFIPKMTVDIFQVEVAAASFMMIPFVLAIAVGSPVAGRLIDSIGSKIMILVSVVLIGIGMYLFSFSHTNFVIYYAAGIITGLGLSVVSGSSLRYIMLNEVQAIHRATSQGMLTIFIAVGQLTGAATISALVASLGHSKGFTDSFEMLAVLAIILLVSALGLKKKSVELQSTKGLIEN